MSSAENFASGAWLKAQYRQLSQRLLGKTTRATGFGKRFASGNAARLCIDFRYCSRI